MSGQQLVFNHITADKLLQHASGITADALRHIWRVQGTKCTRRQKSTEMRVIRQIG